MMLVKIILSVCMLVWWFERKLTLSLLVQSIDMLYVDCGGDSQMIVRVELSTMSGC